MSPLYFSSRNLPNGSAHRNEFIHKHMPPNSRVTSTAIQPDSFREGLSKVTDMKVCDVTSNSSRTNADRALCWISKQRGSTECPDLTGILLVDTYVPYQWDH